MARQNIERQQELEPKRMEYAKQQITAKGYSIINETDTCIKFVFKNKIISFFPYSGWHTGATITDGRGIKKLLNQI